jgi:hypothetical protein
LLLELLVVLNEMLECSILTIGGFTTLVNVIDQLSRPDKGFVALIAFVRHDVDRRGILFLIFFASYDFN